MTSKSKNKGNRFEREIRDLLNESFDTQEFARTPNSGAIMGLSNWEKNKNLEDATKTALGSDIICPSWFKFSVECKNYGDKPNYSKMLGSSDTDLDGWIGEVLFDAYNTKRTPLLFFRTTRKGTYAVLPIQFLKLFSHQPFNFLKYNQDFIIVDCINFLSVIKVINEWNDQNFSDIQRWLEESIMVKRMIDNMLARKKKK